MARPNRLPSQADLQARFSYDPETGVLTWRQRPREHFPTTNAWATWNARYAGKPAGNRRVNGYLRVRIGRTQFLAHRIIWKMVTSEEPPETLDHRDRDTSDNRWSQLRPASHAEQTWNKQYKVGVSGFRGVCVEYGKYRVRISDNYIKRHLGSYDTPEEASAIYEAAALKLRGKFHPK